MRRVRKLESVRCPVLWGTCDCCVELGEITQNKGY